MPAHFISVTDAATMTSRCRSQKETILSTNYQSQDIVPVCETFERSAFDAILADENCSAVRIYTAMDSSYKLRFVIVGVNEDNEDIFISDTSTSEIAIPSVIENGLRCPATCPPSSSLNS